MSANILTTNVGASIKPSLTLVQQAMEKLVIGEEPTPYFGIGFKDAKQMLSVFTEKRWDLLATLRANGPSSIAELARLVNRDYKNVHTDVERLIEWLAIEKNENGMVFTPYDEIIVDVHLPKVNAA